jgi:hypothetical protein
MIVKLQDLIDARRMAADMLAEIDVEIAKRKAAGERHEMPRPVPVPVSLADWHFFGRLKRAQALYEATR